VNSCGHHETLEWNFPGAKSGIANPLKSRWGRQSYRDSSRWPTRCFSLFIPLSLSRELDTLDSDRESLFLAGC
jgi:hypothetical protein